MHPLENYCVVWSLLEDNENNIYFRGYKGQKKVTIFSSEEGNAEVIAKQIYTKKQKVPIEIMILDNEKKLLAQRQIFLEWISPEILLETECSLMNVYGENIDLTITLSNISQKNHDIVLECDFPENFMYQDSSFPPTHIQDSLLVWKFPNFANKRVLKVTFTARKVGEFSFVTTLKGEGITSLKNKSFASIVPVACYVVGQENLQVYQNENVVRNLRVKSRIKAEKISVHMIFPEGVSQNLQWQLENLLPGEEKLITYNFSPAKKGNHEIILMVYYEKQKLYTTSFWLKVIW